MKKMILTNMVLNFYFSNSLIFHDLVKFDIYLCITCVEYIQSDMILSIHFKIQAYKNSYIQFF